MDDDRHLLVRQGFDYEHISSAATTNVKASAGFLHAITLNTATAGSKITVFDGEVGGTMIAEIITGSNTDPLSLVYDVEFDTQLTIVTSGTAQDITVAYK
ncbi:MAG: hypothetical protein ACTSRU_08610 [Candidatus Hodarchaeales archaeon]